MSISLAFSDDQRVVIEDAIDRWCTASGGQWCPEIVTWSDRGRISPVDEIPLREEDEEVCPDGEKCFVSGRNDGDNITIALEEWNYGVTQFWRTAAHELGHYCTRHIKRGLMSPLHGYGDDTYDDFSIDGRSLKAWRNGCGFED